jgi:hypothetical protein
MLLEFVRELHHSQINNISIDSTIGHFLYSNHSLSIVIDICEILSKFLISQNIQVEISRLPNIDIYKIHDSDINFQNTGISLNIYILQSLFKMYDDIKTYIELLQEPYRQFLIIHRDVDNIKLILQLLIYSIYYNSSVEDIKLVVDINIKIITKKMIKELHPKLHMHRTRNLNPIINRTIKNRYNNLVSYVNHKQSIV